LKDLKEKYVDLMNQQESTLFRGFDFICKNYEEKLTYLCQKLQEECDGKPLSKHEISLKA